jgi:hypothetical protein
MKEYAITPDLGATEEVNIVEAVLEATKESAARKLEYLTANPPKEGKTEEETKEINQAWDEVIKEAQEALTAAEQALAEFEPADDQPTVTIGYIHPRKYDSIGNQKLVAFRGWTPNEATVEQLDSLTDIARELVRFGVKGHKGFGFPFMQVKAFVGSTELLATAEEVIDFYQATTVFGMKILQVLAGRVREYNELAEKKRTPSSLPAGIDPVNSTAESATTTYESGEDAKSPPNTP